MSDTDDRIVNSEGAPFGPILAGMLRAEQVLCFASKDADKWFRLGALLDMAAGYVEAVVEGKGPDAARVAKLEAALRDATPFVVTSGVGTFTHPRAKANRDAVLWAIHDLLPGTIRAEGIETPRAALEDPK